jgi:N-acetylneuraminic acid mutarotase
MAGAGVEPHKRYRHASATVGGRVCVWGGINSSQWREEAWSSSLHLFNPLDETWTTSGCSETPPLGLDGCSCASEGDSLYIYGGEGVEGDYQNTLHKLDTTSCTWTLLSSDGPRKKRASGIVKFRDCLFLFGGYEEKTGSIQDGAEFKDYHDGKGWTNEIHMFDLTKGEEEMGTTNLYSLQTRDPNKSSHIQAGINAQNFSFYLRGGGRAD